MRFNINISSKQKLHNIILMLIFFIVQADVWGQLTLQTAEIPDPAFRQFLLERHPEVMDSNGRLIINNANNIYSPIDCSNQNIKDLTGIEYFHNISSLNCSHNQLTFFPEYSPYYPLRKIDCSFNKIEDLGLLNMPYIDSFICNNNNLTFDDLLPIASKNPAVFYYAPQAALPVEMKIELTEGSAYTIKFPSEDTSSSTTFELFKKNFNSIGTNIQNKFLPGNTFVISQVLPSDTGVYHIQATNKLLPQLILSTTEQRLVVVAASENVFTPNGDNKNDNFYIQCGNSIRIYNQFGQQIKQIEGSNFWDGTDQDGYEAPMGTYIIRCSDSSEIVVTLLR